MEKSANSVLYETRYHASRRCSSSYPPQLLQQNEGVKGSMLSLISARGVSQLREKLTGYRRKRKLRKWISLFVSPRGQYVAVALGNHLTILHKDDDYQEPRGFFSSNSIGTFSFGIWSESHGVLGVVDDTDVVYFLRANGEEITRITKRHLKVSLPIVGLIPNDDSDINRSFLCSFSVLFSDGSLQEVEVSQNPIVSIRRAQASNFDSNLLDFPTNVYCLSYHQELSLLAVVGAAVRAPAPSSGSYSLSLWRRTRNLDLKQVVSAKLEGLYSKPEGFLGRLTSPKALISPEGKFIAALDLRGSMSIFKLDQEQSSLLDICNGERDDSEVGSDMNTRGKESLSEIEDFTWWSNQILVLAKRSGIITMIDVLSGIKLLERDPVNSMIILERVENFPGNLLLLECKLSDSTNEVAASNLQIDRVIEDTSHTFAPAKLHWSLLSFLEKSVSEMYDILISNQKYQTALDLANCHGLDKDEVLKAQWLHSPRGVKEINTLLSVIKDPNFVLAECLDKVGVTEDAARALITHGLYRTDQYRFSKTELDENGHIWEFRVARLKLLQYRDKLETFLGINMGRFSVQEYSKFLHRPINEAAQALAESGKIGALNLLFKRHPYSLSPLMLKVLAAIPETLPVQSYGQLLPGSSSPSNLALREKDWVECRDMVAFIKALPDSQENSIHLKTEPILELCLNITWPSHDELATWYKNRARDIDSLSGQLDNSLCLIDFACRKGISELEDFREDISYLLQLIYSDGRGDEVNFTMTLAAWEQLSDYEKFKMMLKDVKDDNVLERLYEKAIPFMHKRFRMISSVSVNVVMDDHSTADKKVDSFLVRWLKETASGNNLELCLKVIEEGCRDLQSNNIFTDTVEAVDCAIQCIYLCRTMDRWSTMASILSRLAETRDFDIDLKRKLKLAEGHVEAGRILSFYQVPKPINFFLDAQSDEKGVKQIIRLILSKFVRRQSGHSDNDWASMWRDLQSLQEKAFPFLDQEYMLVEFCRGLLKAGKFSLARNYLRGTASVALAMEKAENLVVQAAREYFFSASSLACSEIWKAKECLTLFPNSRSVRAEADIIDALTVKLPTLGVSILPVQFKQINDPMEVIKMAITSQSGVYLNVDELVEVAKLLGLSSKDDICAVQEAIAREAAVAGDLQLASDLCLALAKMGHGPAWDLCAAMARGPDVENMGIGSRKQLLGFALSYCDEESIGELLHAWKDLDMQDQCEQLVMLTGTYPQEFSAQACSNSERLHKSPDIVDIRSYSQQVDGTKCDDQEAHIKNIRNIISRVVEDGLKKNNSDWESFLQENGKILSFAAVHLPWLLELSFKAEHGKKPEERFILGKGYSSPRTKAMITILTWLARNDFAPRDDLIASLAKSIMEPPVTEEEDIIGSSFLLNLLDAFHGVKVIEEQVKTRKEYNEICSIMSVGIIYSSLHNSTVECKGAALRRQMLLQKFQQKHSSLSSDELHNIDTAQSSFWRDWKLKLDEQKRVADHSRVLERIIPGVDVIRFLSRDINYMENIVFSLIESVKLEKRHILEDLMNVAYTYGLNHTKVLLQYLDSVLVSDVWAPDDITAEMADFEKDILSCAAESIKTVSLSVYPAIDGCDKQRLAYIYRLLSDCYLQLEATEEPVPTFHPDPLHITTELSSFYKVVEQECLRVSFIKNLNFKNIVGLHGLNFEFFSSEVYAHVNEYNVEVLALMVDNLRVMYGDLVPKDLITSEDVYRHFVFSLLNAFKVKSETQTEIRSPETLHMLISELEHIYNVCHKFIRAMKHVDILDTLRKFLTTIPFTRFIEVIPDDSPWQDCLIFLTNFWLRLIDDVQEFTSQSSQEEKYDLESLLCCLKVFTRLVLEGTVSPRQGWDTVITYANLGLTGGFANNIFLFCRAMIFSGCGFQAIAEIYSEAASMLTGSGLVTETENSSEKITDITHIYLSILESILYDLATGSNEDQNLRHLLSSLSILDGDLEALKMVRHAVWERITKFSDDLSLPSHVRVYALELLQFISASAQSQKAFPIKQQSDVLPWEGWDGLRGAAATSIRTTPDYGVLTQGDQSSRLTSTLVALKSSQLVKVISPSLEIRSDDLSSVETAVCCFRKLCEDATSRLQVDALIAIMEEWEGLFTNKKDEADSTEVVDANDWTNDDWDEGWESFQEGPVVEETKKEDFSLSVHPLHICWMEIFKKLVADSRLTDLVKLIDQSIVKPNGALLDQVEADCLCQILGGSDCFLALKVALLLPYEALRLQCLDAVEDKLKQGGISDTNTKDFGFLILVISSGLVSTIICKPNYGTTFSFLCFMVGSYSRQYQESQAQSGRKRCDDSGDLAIFVRIVFPCFVSELVKADQQVLGGFLVTKLMHTNASLSLVNVAEASLGTYLQRQLYALESSSTDSSNVEFDEMLRNTISQLSSKSISLVQSALSSLRSNVK